MSSAARAYGVIDWIAGDDPMVLSKIVPGDTYAPALKGGDKGVDPVKARLVVQPSVIQNFPNLLQKLYRRRVHRLGKRLPVHTVHCRPANRMSG